ncbi:RHS repeat protein [Comamonas piscis]|uniref:RHS repeat protein n=1 Tax=Comamonas piscis TaxID=1562974 RepID=A0A7G5EGU7_9BURK|nr:RHS repeat domain-containing protein [Comamonas piscis]QMV73222.1 RHS repeat protein [Comamonas piscis]WSO36014.1 RHS repeat domain-containing protein [Comamonas piscis]
MSRELSWDKAGHLTSMLWSGLQQGTGLPDMLDSLPEGSTAKSAGMAQLAKAPQTMLGELTSRQYHYDSLGQMVGIQTPVGMSRFAYDAAGRLTGADTPHAGQQRWKFYPAGNRLPVTGTVATSMAGEAITGELDETDRQRAQPRASSQANPVSRQQIGHGEYNPLQGRPEQTNGQQLSATQKWAGNRVGEHKSSDFSPLCVDAWSGALYGIEGFSGLCLGVVRSGFEKALMKAWPADGVG